VASTRALEILVLMMMGKSVLSLMMTIADSNDGGGDGKDCAVEVAIEYDDNAAVAVIVANVVVALEVSMVDDDDDHYYHRKEKDDDVVAEEGEEK
jgi:hypothetical protein